MTWQLGLMIIGIIVYGGYTASFILVKRNCDISFLDPMRNYDKWKQINWFGVIITTFLLNIIFLPYAIFYWLCKLIYWIFTVGRE